MHDDPTKLGQSSPNDPVALARRDLTKPLPRRFYKAVGVEARGDQFILALDGRPVRTPAKTNLALPTRALAEAVAAEWRVQVEFIDPSTMPLTRLVNVALDGVAREPNAIVAEIAKYGNSDLLCYRADGPEKLLKAQAEAWDPILAASEARLGARFVCGEGIVFVEQPARTKEAVHAALAAVQAQPFGHFGLAALHVMTALTGSVLIALAIAAGETSVETAWAAAHVDENFQMDLWGEDPEAMAKRARRFEEMAAAALLWRLVQLGAA
ncbi:MAG: ATP12 family chaperone protein [Beijerinckiaceae bacterium]